MIPSKTGPEPSPEIPAVPMSFRAQVILTIKLLVGGAGLLGALALVERMVAE